MTAVQRPVPVTGAPVSRSGTVNWRLLLGISVVAAAGEAAALQLLHLDRSVGLAPQVVAPPPYAVFHDLRWLLVYHRSMVGFTLEALGIWLGRATLSAVLLRAAWADPRTRPGFVAAWRRSLAFTLVCAVLMTPFAVLMFGVAVASVSWLVLAAVPSVLAVAAIIGHGSAARRWYACAPPARVAGWMALAFTGYTVIAGVLTVSPAPAVVALAALAGVFDAWVWAGTVGVVSGTRLRTKRLPVTAIGLAAFAGVLVAGTAIGFHVTRISVQLAGPDSAPWADGMPVVVASGFGTPWNGTPTHFLGPGFTEWRFSYAGMSGGSASSGRPIAYVGAQTYAPLPVLVRRMAAQVQAFHTQTGRPVSLVAESEGALVAEAYLHATPDAPVDHLVILSPLVEPGRVYYPPAAGSGYGVATGWELRGLSATIESLGSEVISGDNPLLRSVADHAPQLRRMLTCPVAGVTRQLAVLPLADATSTPYAPDLALPSVVVPGFHGGLLGQSHVERLVAAFLRTGEVPRSATLAFTNEAIRAGATAWQVPELPVATNPAWSSVTPGSCAADDTDLRAWAYGTSAG